MRRTRKRGGYFEHEPGAPEPVVVEVKERARFSDVDVMGVVWFGRYPRFIELGAEELDRRCGLTYIDFIGNRIMAPIAECHIDYHASIFLEEEFTVRATMHYSEAAVIRKEFAIIKSDGTLAASGYTVQMFLGPDRKLCTISPEIIVKARERWRKGEFHK